MSEVRPDGSIIADPEIVEPIVDFIDLLLSNLEVEAVVEAIDTPLEVGGVVNDIDGSSDSSQEMAKKVIEPDELIEACKQGNIEVVKLYLNQNANASEKNVFDLHGNCPVLWASWSGHIDIVRLLLSNGFSPIRRNNICDTAFIFSCWHGFDEIAKYLLSIHPEELDYQSNEKMTGFLCACQQGHLEVAEYLISIGCNVKIKNKYGNDAFLCAATTGKFNIVQFLLNKDLGFDINAVNNAGNTALVEAAHHGHEDILCLLLSKGCNVDITTASGDSAFLHACWRAFPSIAKRLIRHNCNTQLKNKYNNLAMDYAKGDVKTEIEECYKTQCTWNRRKAFLLVLIENGYLGAAGVTLRDDEHRNHEELLGNRDLISIIISYI